MLLFIIIWRIPGTGEPGGLPSMGLHRVGHDWSDLQQQQQQYWSLSSYLVSMEQCILILILLLQEHFPSGPERISLLPTQVSEPIDWPYIFFNVLLRVLPAQWGHAGKTRKFWLLQRKHHLQPVMRESSKLQFYNLGIRCFVLCCFPTGRFCYNTLKCGVYYSEI